MVKWVLDKSMFRKYNEFSEAGLASLTDVIDSLGYEYTAMDYVPFSRKEDITFPYDFDDCVIPYSTINFGKFLKPYYGSFLDEESLKFHNYHSKLQMSNDVWVNGDFIITTFYDFELNFDKYANLFQTNKLFIRPNSGSKLFTGLPITGIDDLQYQSNALRQLSGVVDNSLIMVSTGKVIKEEYRFIVAGKNIIDGSQYSLMGDHNERHFYTTEAYNLADKVAKSGRTPTEVFTCDIAKMADGSVKIVELNSFNCAGWYACEPEKIIKGVSEYVQMLYNKDKAEGLI